MSEQTHRAHWLGCVTTLAVLVLCAAQVAAAPRRKPTPPTTAAAKPENWKEMKLTAPDGAERNARAMLRDGNLSNQEEFDGYWKYFFSRFTLWEDRNGLPELRKGLKSQLKGRDGEAHDRLVKQIALPMLEEIAADEGYDLRVRYNALLMLGELNSIEQQSDPKSKPTALPEAVGPLLSHLDPKLPVDDTHDALRVAALAGLANHAERGGIVDDKQRKRAQAALQSLAGEQSVPDGRTEEVHAWLQKRAKEVLESMNRAPLASR